eukprot:COSAG02_NODE_12271_length_1571_cov_1.282609_2_plen_84_part_00
MIYCMIDDSSTLVARARLSLLGLRRRWLWRCVWARSAEAGVRMAAQVSDHHVVSLSVHEHRLEPHTAVDFELLVRPARIMHTA